MLCYNLILQYKSLKIHEITDDEKAWIINITCQKPLDLGYAAETWTYSLITQHVQANAESAGYPRLSTISRSMVHFILNEAEIKPFRIKYYCETRDSGDRYNFNG